MESKFLAWHNGLSILSLINPTLTKTHHWMNCLKKETKSENSNTQHLPQQRISKSKRNHSNFCSKMSSNLFSFTREKVEQMLRYITETPPENCNTTRGHAVPFHCDMIFQFHNKKINDRFFTSSLQTPSKSNIEKMKFQS